MKTEIKKSPEMFGKGVKKMKFFGLMLLAIAVALGYDATLGSGVALAAIPVAVTAPGDQIGAQVPGEPVTTETAKEGSPNLLERDVADKVTQIYSTDAQVYYMLRNFSRVKPKVKNGTWSRVHAFYQADERPWICDVTDDTANPNTSLTANVKVNNIKMWTKDCVVNPIYQNYPAFSATSTYAAGAIVIHEEDMWKANAAVSAAAWNPSQWTNLGSNLGYNYDNGPAKQIGKLQLIIVDIDRAASTITVQALNAKRASASDPDTAYVPAIPAGVKLTRLPMLGSELDAQAPSWEDLPTDTENYVATFHTQFEVTPDYLKHGKEINWGKAQIKDRTMKDFFRAIEMNIISGQKAMITDVIDQDRKYQMGGFMYFNTNEYEYDPTQLNVDGGFSASEITEMMARVFADNNGSENRVLLMGTGFTKLVQNTKDFEKFNTTMTPCVEMYGFKFRGISNNFGTLLAKRYNNLDKLGMSDCALILDIENLALVEAEGLSSTPLELKKSGQRNVEASYITEKLSFELRNPKTHMLVKPIAV